MLKKILLNLIIGVSTLLFASCGKLNHIIMSESSIAEEKMEQIVSSIQNSDKETLRLLFSQNALEFCDDFDNEAAAFFDFVQGEIESWELKPSSSHEISEYGKKTVMVISIFKVTTGVDVYSLMMIDYPTDTINPDNEGVYMLEIVKESYDGEWKAVEERMRPGIAIVESRQGDGSFVSGKNHAPVSPPF